MEIKAFDAGELFFGIFQAGFDVARQIDLADVAGDHGFGAEADAGEKHLHLLGRGVLRFIENHISAVERAPAHIGQGRDFDQAFFQKLGHAVEAHQIVKRIVKRAQIGVDFLRQVAGQKAELFAGFHRRAHQHDALDLVLFHRIHRCGHGQIGFAGAGRA